MRIAEEWKDYSVISTGDGYKVEKWGNFTLRRPDPQVIWHATKQAKDTRISAVYERGDGKTGEWQRSEAMPDSWVVAWKDIKFKVQPMNFKHTGVFPEQAVNWKLLQDTIKAAGRTVKVLNLFAYTGGATLACAKAGASVVHVDAAKSMVERAKENAVLSGLQNANIRYIVDDCEKFVQKEIRRENKYDIIIMDPPSFGRGPNGEMWKLEDKIHDFIQLCAQILSSRPIMIMVNSYTTGLQPTVMSNILRISLPKSTVSADEIGLPTLEWGVVLPAGCTAIASFKEKKNG